MAGEQGGNHIAGPVGGVAESSSEMDDRWRWCKCGLRVQCVPKLLSFRVKISIVEPVLRNIHIQKSPIFARREPSLLLRMIFYPIPIAALVIP